MLLFRFLSDFTQKCKTAIEIGMPFDDIYDNFFCLSSKKTSNNFNSENFAFYFLTTKQGTLNFKGIVPQSIIKHKLSKPPRVCEQRMARIELCHLPLGLEQFVCVYNNETQQTITIA